jgi:tetratricopeptide (TPR) repeat protein
MHHHPAIVLAGPCFHSWPWALAVTITRAMPSERLLRQIDRFLDQAEEAATNHEWARVADAARAVLAIDHQNEDAEAFRRMAEANLGASIAADPSPAPAAIPAMEQPESFVGGRYQVRRFLGEGGKKRVFLAHDELLDRDVAFALIKADGLDDTGRQRIAREAQAMGRMSAHPHIVSIFDLGEEQGAPYIVTELMDGGDVEGELERAGGPLQLTRALDVAKCVASGLAFAHGRGVVHRDLKPGNVWLTSEGVAKIGDFGLAVAEGRSRLTQHGMMVGTYAYMPPEQALGGEVTPRSDLYSLGAMLYELVTGKPPFEADDPTAVISQHLNAEPVAPSWRTERCPPPLEDLILALLAKDPSTRPASAAEVLTLLEGIDVDAPSRSHSGDSTNRLERLARGVFVGRERELERLRGALDDAFAGHGSVVMLVGEPGIGKTRTTQELETYARMRGAKVLWGRAHESSGAPPYWPWVQVARAYREETPDAEVRRRQYEPYAVELQRIFPALRDLFPTLPEPPAESEEGQFRLFDAFSAFARSVAQETPLVFVLDDLHWADGATLGLLTHLARELARARILVCGTYRDTDLDRRHPLATALADLGREDLFSRISLRGLSLTETEEYLRQAAHVEPARELVARIYEETEGNPFFLSEVVNLMTEEGSFAKDSVSDIAVPEGVRQALGRRLDRLSGQANELLTVLAVAGRDFEHSLVQSLSAQDEGTTLRLLEEALRARVLEEVGAGRYRFTHALMQETLLGELSAARRVLLHGQIAESMEQLYGEGRDTLAAIAEHYHESTALNARHARQAAYYLRLAAEQVVSALAPEEAVHRYQRCLDLVQAAPDNLGEDEAALHAALARCLAVSGQAAAAWEHMDRSVALEPQAIARAIALTRFRQVAPPSQWGAHAGLLQRVVSELGPAPSPELCALLALLSNLDFGREGDELFERAHAMAEALELVDSDYPDDLVARPLQVLVSRGEYSEAQSAIRLVLRDRAAESTSTLLHTTLVNAFVFPGDVAELERAHAEASGFARATGNKQFGAWVGASHAGLEWRKGHQAAARELLDQSRSVSPYPGLAGAYFDIQEGRLTEALLGCSLTGNPRLAASGAAEAFAMGVQARVLYLTRDAQAAELFEEWLVGTNRRMSHGPGPTGLGSVGEVLCELAAPDDLLRIAVYLATLPRLRYWDWGDLPDYLRGAIALKLDRQDEAMGHFRAGLDYTSRTDVGFEVDAARCHQGLAEIAERRGQRAEAMRHLDAAGELFARHGARLYLDQVLAKKEILKA